MNPADTPGAKAYTPEERARLLEKIKKCLALSASPEPHEAAAAMRQAQKLMALIGVTAEEATAPEMADALVKTREGFGRCLYMSELCHLVERCFGVHTIFERNPGSAARLNVRYVGPRGLAELAEYTHRVCQRAMDAAWRRHLDERPDHRMASGKRSSFYVGWVMGVRDKVEAMAISDEQRASFDRWVLARYGALDKQEMDDRKLDIRAAREGLRAAEDFSINRPVGAEPLKIGGS
jgi:hypothetical protein